MSDKQNMHAYNVSSPFALACCFLTTHKAMWYIIPAVSVYLSDDNLRKPWCTKFIFAHPKCLHVYGSSSYMKVTGSRSRSH